jgi:hypothetical protein
MEFGEPVIRIEFGLKDERKERLSPQFVARHMRNPVYFHHAIKRLSGRLAMGIYKANYPPTCVTRRSRPNVGCWNG